MSDFASRRALVALGSNIQPRLHLQKAVQRLGRLGRVRAASQVWQSKPVGYPDQDDFLNAAVMLDTELDAPTLRLALRQLEHELGRVRDPENKNGPRTIDLDLVLLRGQRRGSWQLLDAEIGRQAFLAVPLAELAPQLVLPGEERTLEQMAQQLAMSPLLLREDICLNSVAGVESDMVPADRRPTPGPSPPTEKN